MDKHNEVIIDPAESVRGNNAATALCPQGTHHAQCVDVCDLGIQLGPQGGTPGRRVAILFETELRKTEGKFAGTPYLLTRIFSADLNGNAPLVTTFRTWFCWQGGFKKPLKLSGLIGKYGTLTVVHKDKGGKTFASITHIGPRASGSKAFAIAYNGKPPAHIQKWIDARLDKPVSVDTPTVTSVSVGATAPAGQPQPPSTAQGQSGNNDWLETA